MTRHLIRDSATFVHESVVNDQFAHRDDFIPELSELIRRSREVLGQNQYKDILDEFLGQLQKFVVGIKSDEGTQQLVENLRKCNADLFLDPNTGNYKFKSALAGDVVNVVGPVNNYTIE